MPDEKTKGESVEFTTVSIEGSVMKKKNGEWSKTKTFTSYEKASEYLDSLLTSSNVSETLTPGANENDGNEPSTASVQSIKSKTAKVN